MMPEAPNVAILNMNMCSLECCGSVGEIKRRLAMGIKKTRDETY
jgi:hypothetical protein